MSAISRLIIIVFCLCVGMNLSQAGWTRTTGPYGGPINSLAISGANLFAGADNGVYRSADNGVSWVKTSMPNIKGRALVGTGSTIYAGSDDAVYRSTDNGSTWTSVTIGYQVNALAISGGIVFAGTTGAGVFCSADNGATWTNSSSGIPATTTISALAVSGTNIFAAAYSSVYVSSDNGAHWAETSYSGTTVLSMTASGGNLYIGTLDDVTISSDNGVSWTARRVGSLVSTHYNKVYVAALIVSGNTLYAGTAYGVYQSTDIGVTWEKKGSLPGTSPYVFALAVSGANVVAGTRFDGIFISGENELHWTESSTGITNISIKTLASSGSRLFAVTSGRAFASTDNGGSWTSAWADINTDHYSTLGPVPTVAIFDGALYTYEFGNVLRSTDNGVTWINRGNLNSVTSFVGSGATLFAGTNLGIYRSLDSGTTWTEADSGLNLDYSIRFLAASGSTIYAGTQSDGIYASTDNGDTWTDIGLGRYYKYGAFAAAGSNLFAWEPYRGFVYSGDKGATWKAVDFNWSSSTITSLVVAGEYLMAGTSDDGIWQRPLSEITSIDYRLPSVPAQFSLNQNYPNPFNPSTTIVFSLPTRSFVSLKIFDVMGRDVATILSDELPAGNYSRQWNASGYPSGVYFYRLQAGAYTETKRLVLTK